MAGQAPGSVGNPRAYVTPFATSSAGTARVLYPGTDRHIHELYLQSQSGASWTYADLAVASVNGAPDAVGDPFAYVTTDSTGSTARVVYRGKDSHIHELYLQPGARWTHADLAVASMNGAPDAAGAPFGYVTRDSTGSTARVVYRGKDLHIHELYLQPGARWTHADLAVASVNGAPDAVGDPFAYVTTDSTGSTARVVYRGTDSSIYRGIDSDIYELSLRLQPNARWNQADLTEITP